MQGPVACGRCACYTFVAARCADRIVPRHALLVVRSRRKYLIYMRVLSRNEPMHWKGVAAASPVELLLLAYEQGLCFLPAGG